MAQGPGSGQTGNREESPRRSVSGAREFQGSRVDWSAQLRTIAGDMPESTLVTSFQGRYPRVKARIRAVPKARWLSVFHPAGGRRRDTPAKSMSSIAASRRARAEKGIPGHRCLRRAGQSAQGKQSPSASYSVVCMPAAKSKGSGPK